ncbi:MAG: hypothetical protein WA102_06220 [Candidatus Methanoperedens sp.]
MDKKTEDEVLMKVVILEIKCHRAGLKKAFTVHIIVKHFYTKESFNMLNRSMQ